MPRLTARAHAAVRAVVAAGDTVIDATAGNGRDTSFLAGVVGPTGRVFAFDIQAEALARTAERLGSAPHVTLLKRNHAEMGDAIPAEHRGRVAAVMFNLGYLPGGDHSIATRAGSTRTAMAAALDLLRPGGVLTVLTYPGHAGGAEEAAAVAETLAPLGAHEHRGEWDGPAAPRLFVVHKRSAPE